MLGHRMVLVHTWDLRCELQPEGSGTCSSCPSVVLASACYSLHVLLEPPFGILSKTSGYNALSQLLQLYVMQ